MDSTGPTEGDTIRPVVLYEDWECFVSDRLTIRLHLYPLENKYYEIKEPSNGGPNVLFGHELWTYYEIRNDTMYIKDSPDDDFRYNWLCCKFFITMHSETVMEMDYMGALPAIPTKTNYLFIRKN